MRALCPMPKCLSCGKPCKRRWVRAGVKTKYCSYACVPISARQRGGRTSGEHRLLVSRVKKFRDELHRLKALPKLTGEDLMASFQMIADRVYKDGYWACEAKWRYREQQRQRAAREASEKEAAA